MLLYLLELFQTPDEVQYKRKMGHDLHKRDWKRIEKLLISQGFIRHCPEIVQLFRSYNIVRFRFPSYDFFKFL
jgi:hypothetical protein